MIFINKNIGCVDNDYTDSLIGYIKKYKNIFVKMDIEGGEFP